MKMNITAAVGYLCHLPLESTNATKTKATKNDAILSINEVRSILSANKMWLRGMDLRPEK